MNNTSFSENEDDPDVYESSGDDWEKEEEKKPNRRSSRRLSKRPRKTIVESGSEDFSNEDLSEEEPKKRKTKKVSSMKKSSQKSSKDENLSDSSSSSKVNSDNKSTPSISVAKGTQKRFLPKTIYSEDFATGTFVILKKDAQAGDPSKHPCIWRIDGKALLQKYEAFDEDNKVRHKSTSVYTGWSPMDKDLYAPVSVDVLQHNNHNLKVELHWDKLKQINIDSD